MLSNLRGLYYDFAHHRTPTIQILFADHKPKSSSCHNTTKDTNTLPVLQNSHKEQEATVGGNLQLFLQQLIRLSILV